MPKYFFFQKEQQIVVLESVDRERNALLVANGWEKQFEEIEAVDAESALLRLTDIRKEEIATERAFIGGSAFSSLLNALLK